MSNKSFSLDKSKIKAVLTVFLIIVLLITFWNSNPKSTLLEFQEDAMVLSAPEEDGFRVTIAYTDIIEIEQLSSVDLGTCIDGVDLENRKNGSWKNDAYGDYSLCIYPDLQAYIVIHTTQGVAVFNYESTDTTQQLYEALLEYVAEKTP